MKISANVAKVGKYSLKVINSLIHGGPYVAVNIGKKRVAWVSFKTKKHETYDGVDRKDLESINEVDVWFQDTSNYNLAATKWNDFKNGVTVSLIGE
jgi:hypothetical protein